MSENQNHSILSRLPGDSEMCMQKAYLGESRVKSKDGRRGPLWFKACLG